MNRSEFIDYLLEKGECNRFNEHQIDALEQFCFALYENTKLDKPMERIAELEKEKQLVVEQHDMWRQQWHELKDSLPSRDLEQQLKILKKYANTCGILREEPSTRSLHELIMDLEAKALKEGDV